MIWEMIFMFATMTLIKRKVYRSKFDVENKIKIFYSLHKDFEFKIIWISVENDHSNFWFRVLSIVIFYSKNKFFKNVFDNVDENEIIRIAMIDDERFNIFKMIHF